MKTVSSPPMMHADLFSTMTRHLAHPLANIRALSETVASGRVKGRTVQGYALMCTSEICRLARLVENLATDCRFGAACDMYLLQPVSLDTVVRRSLNEFGWLLQHKGLSVTRDVPADLPLVRADPNAIHLMLTNVLAYAIQASAEQHSVGIRAWRCRSRVGVAVAIPAVAIPAHVRVRRAHKWSDDGRSGPEEIELGLRIARRIVSAHNGKLHIQGTSGQATVVSVTLPQFGSLARVGHHNSRTGDKLQISSEAGSDRDSERSYRGPAARK